jgi:hypothetical protein
MFLFFVDQLKLTIYLFGTNFLFEKVIIVNSGRQFRFSLNDYLNSVAIACCAFLRSVKIEKEFLDPNLFIYLDPLHHKGIRLALEAFAICKTENILSAARIPSFSGWRKDEKET